MPMAREGERMKKFGIGQSAARFEDRRFLTGAGSYLDDESLPGQAVGVFLRSPHAHARLGGIDVSAALAGDGVLGVFTGPDLRAAGVGDLPCMADAPNADGSPCYKPPRPALAIGRVRHVGEPVALIVAETRARALDAAEAIFVEYDELPSVVETGAAMNGDAPRLWDEAPGNRCFDWYAGDAEAAAAALDGAAHRVELELVNNRLAPNSMEPRGAIASFEDGRLVLRVSCQGVHYIKRILLSGIFDCAEEDIRVICKDVGGGFGAKIFCYPEYVAALHAAQTLGR
ncbi:MAG: xanthine dehydrogenase family protein molybdopterin-binding subunit, partial [Gammaproteobacteria bacterium]|nr:xanthine dehydrogenase family protein molybdopterin-binding subunit [Gammaproteobacteria bacterium]